MEALGHRARLALAKKHAARRRDEGGAAMFVVAMTIAVLASVGVYALASAATEIKTAGNERRSTQTHYLSTYGILSATHELAGSKADLYVKLMKTNPDTCLSLPNPANATTLNRACRRLGSAEIAGTGKWQMNAVNPYSASAPGSLGTSPMSGDFFVELTDASKAKPPPRYSTDLNVCFVQMTVTSVGLTQPLYPSIANADLAQIGGEGLEMQRARIVAGPIQCPK